MKTVVKTFKPQFADLVEKGSKRQTVRPWPKRPCDVPQEGDRISCRTWTGKPYRSKQRTLGEGRIYRVCEIFFFRRRDQTFRIILQGISLNPQQRDDFARADGFKDAADMREWFDREHGLPFNGIAIFWHPSTDSEKSNR